MNRQDAKSARLQKGSESTPQSDTHRDQEATRPTRT